MTRKNKFPHDWIAPGEFRYCGCGLYLVLPDNPICSRCRNRPTLDDHLCFCGKQAVMMFVHGFRCYDHQWQVEPSHKSGDENVIVTYGKLRKDFKALVEDDTLYLRLEGEMNTLAEKRFVEGVEPLFWMKGGQQ